VLRLHKTTFLSPALIKAFKDTKIRILAIDHCLLTSDCISDVLYPLAYNSSHLQEIYWKPAQKFFGTNLQDLLQKEKNKYHPSVKLIYWKQADATYANAMNPNAKLYGLVISHNDTK